MRRLLFFSLFWVASAVASKGYSRHAVLRSIPQTQDQYDYLNQQLQTHQIDIWHDTGILGQPVDFRVSGDDLQWWMDDLENHNIDTSTMIENVQTLIDSENSRATSTSGNTHPYDIDPSTYHTLDEMNEWLEDIAGRCGSECRLIHIGDSFEGRPIRLIRIGDSPAPRRKVWIDGGIHAREWISPAVVNYIIGRLILDTADPEVAALREAFDWYILPVVNPDGYQYTWTADRLWRKTRSSVEGSGCLGADGNRNFDHMWATVGSSAEPCSISYHGPSPASEPEIWQLQDFVLEEGSFMNFVYLMSMHSYGQILIYPWGYTEDNPPDYDNIVDLAQIGVDAINSVHDQGYTHGRSGRFSGNTMDWGLGVAGIPYSYILELRDTGEFGFILPPQQIRPCAEETWAGVVAMATELI